MKNVYFLSDAHLGSRAIEHGRTQERRLVNFLDSIKHKAAAVYLLGDMFDFWYEFRTVVPKGYTRFLGKLSELTDLGVEVHFFTGNHDLWCGDYLTKECGVMIHREPLTTEIFGKEFYLAHGDGLGDPDKKFKMLRAMFRSRTLQTLFSALHPRWSMELGLNWAKHSRLKRIDGKEPAYMGENNEYLVLYTKEYLKNGAAGKGAEVRLKGHGADHRLVGIFLCRQQCRLGLVQVGHGLNDDEVGILSGENLFLENFVEGETKL